MRKLPTRLCATVTVPHTTSVVYGRGGARRAVRRALEEPPPAVGHLAPPRLPKGNARQPIMSMHARHARMLLGVSLCRPPCWGLERRGSLPTAVTDARGPNAVTDANAVSDAWPAVRLRANRIQPSSQATAVCRPPCCVTSESCYGVASSRRTGSRYEAAMRPARMQIAAEHATKQQTATAKKR